MRRYFLPLIMLVLTASCSRLDFDTSVQVQAWLESLDPNAKVIEVLCTADVEESGTWVKKTLDNQLSALEVLVHTRNQGLEWADMVTAMINLIKNKFPEFVLDNKMGNTPYSKEDEMNFVATFKYKNLSC